MKTLTAIKFNISSVLSFLLECSIKVNHHFFRWHIIFWNRLSITLFYLRIDECLFCLIPRSVINKNRYNFAILIHLNYFDLVSSLMNSSTFKSHDYTICKVFQGNVVLLGIVLWHQILGDIFQGFRLFTFEILNVVCSLCSNVTFT